MSRHREMSGPAVAGAPLSAVAVVVFADSSALPWLRLLRPGFRHCFAVVGGGGRWVLYNPLSHWTQLAPCIGPDARAIAAWYAAAGHVVVVGPAAEPPRRSAPWRPFTCVEAVKRAVGLRAAGVVTPYQLYQRLRRDGYTEFILDKNRKFG